MKQIIKRLVAALLTAITLVFVPVNGYQNAITCHAAAETAMFYALRALVEATTFSMGYSFQTQEDLDVSTRGLENLIESYKNCDDFEDAAYLTGLLYMLEKKKIGDTIEISFENFQHDPINMISPYNCIQYLHNYLAMQFRKSGASYDDKYDVSLNEINSAIGSSNVKTRYCEITENVFKECLYDKQTYCTPEDGMLTGGFLMRSTYSDESAKKNNCYKYWSVYFAAFPSVDFKSKDCPYILTCEPVNGVLKICCRNKSDGAIASGLKIGIRQYDYFQSSAEGHVSRNTKVNYTPQSINASLVDTLYLDTRLYTSYAAYCAYAEKENSYAPALPVVGSTSVSSGISKNITITQTPARTKEIEKTITEAREENPAITQDELDEAVAKAITKANTTTGTPADSSTTDSAALSDIIVSLGYIREIVQQFQKEWTDGSSALQRDVEDVRDNFTVIEGGGDSGSDPEDEDPKIWVPPLFFASRLLKPVMEYFGNPLSEITKFLNRILNSISNLPLLFDKEGELYIGHIFSDMSSIVSYVGSIAQTIKNLPKDIADLIEIPVLNPQEIVEALNEGLVFPNLPVELPEINIPEIKVPDVNVEFPAIPNYMSVLNNILLAVQNIFVIDTAAVDVSAKKLVGIWDKHLPFIPKVQKLISSVSFSDAYEYPVIKIGTPKNIRPYYDSDYIVLLDFGNSDVRQYFVWARTIIKAGLWIAFLYSLLRHFKVRFHVG